MDAILTKLLDFILQGGPSAIIAIFLLVTVGLLYDRKNIISQIEKKDVKIDKIINDYYTGTINLTETMGNIRIVLLEIKNKL